MYGYEKGLNLEDVEFCACGARDGVYVMRDDEGWWYVCADCDLPIANSFVPYESEKVRHRDEEYED